MVASDQSYAKGFSLGLHGYQESFMEAFMDEKFRKLPSYCGTHSMIKFVVSRQSGGEGDGVLRSGPP